jgi:omega-amidase
MRITLVQSMLHWEDAAANRTIFRQRMGDLKGSTDLIVLPEMFTTGFSMRSHELAEPVDGPTVEWMRELAAGTGAAVYGSIILTGRERPYNSGLFVYPDGRCCRYDKRHLFRMAGEHEHYAAGHDRVIVEYLGWRILLQVCYDLRFPVFSRNRNDHDMMLYVANWPEARRHAWSSLLVARAIENQSVVVGVNRVGMDAKGIHYTGDSVLLDAQGQVLAACEPATEAVVTGAADLAELQAFRERFPARLDADDFDLVL